MKISKTIKKVIFSLTLCTVLGIGSNVNAATTVVEDTLPKEIKVGAIQSAFKSGTNSSDTSVSNYPFFCLTEDNNYQLFCSDRKKGELSASSTLTQGTKMEYGLAYILKNSYPSKELVANPLIKQFVSNDGYKDYAGTFTSANKMIDIWVTQMAIWSYQNSIAKDAIKEEGLKATITTDSANVEYFSQFTDALNKNPIVATNVWSSYVEPLVTAAKGAKDPADTTLSVTSSGKWTTDGTNKKSGLITVGVSNNEATYTSYAISLVNASTDVKVYTEAGTQVSDLNNITAGTKIYLVVPSTSAGKTFTLKATATIKYDAAYQYVSAEGYQPSILVGQETKDIAGELTIVPDTASSISTSIYFIGFIILLSGAGIIYANVKPRTQESE